jgi:Family of unknown function (DUF6941)
VSTAATDIQATMLLCDAAHAVGGKLYVLGGGWSMLTKVQPRANMALAVKLNVPWSRANERIHIEAILITDQGDEVTQEADQPVRAEGDLELGRPPGLRHGTPLDATFVLDFQGLDLASGGYVWELRLGGEMAARVPFQVIQPGEQT